MKDQQIHTQTLANGLTLVVEPMSDVQSAAFALLIPAGSIYDPPDLLGTGGVLCDWTMRGAGDRDSRQLSDALDSLGVQRQEAVERKFIHFGGALLADNLVQALQIYADIVRRPQRPIEGGEWVVTGAEQSLMAIEDEPRQKIMQELRQRTYPSPWGLPSEGTQECLAAMTPERIAAHYRQSYRPNGAILGIAGNVEIGAVSQAVELLFGDWEPLPEPAIVTGPAGLPRDHIPHESTQTQIAFAYPSVTYRDPEYYTAWAAVGVLSGGSSSRLFTEVREKRGLCYSVYASLHSLREQARVLGYAGTTNERAQQTLEVTLSEILKLPQGIGEDELQRCKARAKSSLIMQQESSAARATSIAHDWYHLSRVTTLAEIHSRIDSLTVPAVLEHLEKYPPRDFTIVTLGPQPLEVPHGVP